MWVKSVLYVIEDSLHDMGVPGIVEMGTWRAHLGGKITTICFTNRAEGSTPLSEGHGGGKRRSFQGEEVCLIVYLEELFFSVGHGNMFGG